VSTYAIIEGTKVINTIIADEDFIQQYYPDNAVDISDKLTVCMGYDYIDGEFSLPVVEIIEEEIIDAEIVQGELEAPVTPEPTE
jgi:hypothetical protein